MTANPIAIIEAVRRHAERITIFCQAGQIKVPPDFRGAFAYLERSVVAVRAPRPGGIFHPKVWVIRFVGPGEEIRYRFLCLSRNLTFDRSWDTVLRLDGKATGSPQPISQPLAEFVRSLPGSPSPRSLRTRCRDPRPCHRGGDGRMGIAAGRDPPGTTLATRPRRRRTLAFPGRELATIGDGPVHGARVHRALHQARPRRHRGQSARDARCHWGRSARPPRASMRPSLGRRIGSRRSRRRTRPTTSAAEPRRSAVGASRPSCQALRRR